MVPYWVGQSQFKECFPRIPYLDHVMSMIWTGERLLGMVFLTHQGFILSHLRVPLLRVCFIASFAIQNFCKTFICLFYLFLNLNIECYGQWK
jgi:hypothetical protein